MRVRVKIGGRFVPGRRERNVIADIPGRGDGHVIVSAHYDSVWRGPGAIDNATGVEGVRRVGEAFACARARARRAARSRSPPRRSS